MRERAKDIDRLYHIEESIDMRNVLVYANLSEMYYRSTVRERAAGTPYRMMCRRTPGCALLA